MRIVDEIHKQSGSTTIVHVKAHQRDTPQPQNVCFGPLTQIEQQQEYNKSADRLAKASLQDVIPCVPDENLHLPYTALLLHNTQPHPVVYENNSQHLIHTMLHAANKHYHYKGSWHTHLLVPEIWSEVSLHTLSSKKSPETHKKFSVQILGRTLPTFHRLHQTQPSLYLDTRCALCPSPDESSEHLFFHCPRFLGSRYQLLTDLIQTCQQLTVHATGPELRAVLLNQILSPTTTESERNRSAAQLPVSFWDWLLPRCSTAARALKVGKHLHNCVLQAYRNIWHERCDLIKQQGLLFADRIRMLPRHIPLHETTEDDLRSFALAWQRRHSPLPVWTIRKQRSQRQDPAAVLLQSNPIPPIAGHNRPHGILDCAVPRRPRKRNITRPRITLLALGSLSQPSADPASGQASGTPGAPPLHAQPVLSDPPMASCHGNLQLQRPPADPQDAMPAGRSSTKRKRPSEHAASDIDNDSGADGVCADDTGTATTIRPTGRRPKKRPSRYLT